MKDSCVSKIGWQMYGVWIGEIYGLVKIEGVECIR